MTNRWKQWIASILMLAIFFAWIYTAFLPWRASELAQDVEKGNIDLESLPDVLWSDDALRLAANKLLSVGPYKPALIDQYLARSLEARPLYAPTWLNRAKLALRMGDLEAADRYADIAHRLWPTRRHLLWTLAMFRIQMGDNEKALAMLKAYLQSEPTDMRQVALIAKRLEPDPKALVQALLPATDPPDEEPGYYPARLFYVAREIKDVKLAEEAWNHLPDKAYKREKLVFDYIQFMLSVRRSGDALSAWNRYRGGTLVKGAITNPGFEAPLTNGGFGWVNRAVNGVTGGRDNGIRFGGNYSLHLEFDGSENVQYRHFYQTVPVVPGRTYKLTGYWRGEDITTRSGLFVSIETSGGVHPVSRRTKDRYGTWRWEPFSLQLRVPEDALVAIIRIHRNSTDALDRLISGHFWIDNLKLQLVDQTDATTIGALIQ